MIYSVNVYRSKPGYAFLAYKGTARTEANLLSRVKDGGPAITCYLDVYCSDGASNRAVISELVKLGRLLGKDTAREWQDLYRRGFVRYRATTPVRAIKFLAGRLTTKGEYRRKFFLATKILKAHI